MNKPNQGNRKMSTPFNSEWLQPGAVVPVDVPTLAAFAEELRRVNQENEELRHCLMRIGLLYTGAANARDDLLAQRWEDFSQRLRDKQKEKNT